MTLDWYQKSLHIDRKITGSYLTIRAFFLPNYAIQGPVRAQPIRNPS